MKKTLIIIVILLLCSCAGLKGQNGVLQVLSIGATVCDVIELMGMPAKMTRSTARGEPDLYKLKYWSGEEVFIRDGIVVKIENKFKLSGW